jgi:hypothetical protein
VLPGSGVQGFPSSARGGRRGFCRGFRRGFCRAFASRRPEKCPILAAVCGNPGHDRTLLGQNCPILAALCLGNPCHGRTVLSRKCRIVAALPGRADQRPRPRRRRHPPPRRRRQSARCTRVPHDPDVRVPAAAGAADELKLARRKQRAARAAVRPVRDPCRRAQLLGREIAHLATRVGDRGHRRQQQPFGSADPAVAQDRLEQLDVDLAVPPRTGSSE